MYRHKIACIIQEPATLEKYQSLKAENDAIESVSLALAYTFAHMYRVVYMYMYIVYCMNVVVVRSGGNRKFF